ncbi:ABC transporter substrate-binding protein [Bifidobacterium felsineum]|uniref:ABC transporter substrate-binding protein n=1 Tax=Bifidobacterium felsineum TaxID=2045440 RepID=UPI001BDBE4EB|nr:ABC transporter substrate-binding protein [Bifidobacterium felsineum]MBT1164275.1 ABC transporter substrate-binding protein [Bifidobacterium felsineum]
MQSKKLKTIAAAALSAAMLFTAAACGTTDEATSGSDSGSGSGETKTITSYDVSSVKKDDAIAALLPESVTKDGKLTIGTNPSYAPAEFLDADGKTQIGYDMDLAHALGNVFGLKTEIVSSNFDTIIPAIGSKYDLGIAAFTITKERMESVDFVSYFTSGMAYAVAKGNPNKVDASDLCGLNVAVETGTVEEDAINETAKQCKADGKKDITIQSSKQQTDATTAVVTGKADVFFADSPVVGYAIAQTDGQLEQLGKDFDSVPNAIAIKKGDTGTTEAVQKAMQKLMDDGTYGKILKHWGVESGALTKAEVNPNVE